MMNQIILLLFLVALIIFLSILYKNTADNNQSMNVSLVLTFSKTDTTTTTHLK